MRMITVASAVDVFRQLIAIGTPCPQCGGRISKLSTTNQWVYYCDRCDQRFDRSWRAKQPEDDSNPRHDL